MPEFTIITGYAINVMDVPPMPGTDGKAGRAILLREIDSPHNTLVYAMSESIAKDTGHKLVGHGKVKVADAGEIATLASLMGKAK